MAKPVMEFVPPPREAVKQAEPNIEKPAVEGPKYINFRVDKETFREIKKAALDEDMTLGDYMIHAHRTYQSKKG